MMWAVLSHFLLVGQVLASLIGAELATVRYHIDAYVGAGNSTYGLIGSFVVVSYLVAERLR
jgi:hypothetical protein